MDEKEALNTLKAYAICNISSGKLTCLDCPFKGEIIIKNGRSRLACDINESLTDDKIIEAIEVLGE